jgi:hypothetical protein
MEEMIIDAIIFVIMDFEADIKKKEDHTIILFLPNQETKQQLLPA